MTKKEKKTVCNFVENEGFDYCFQHYSGFDDIKDEKFHELRRGYIQSAKKLAEYIGLEDL